MAITKKENCKAQLSLNFTALLLTFILHQNFEEILSMLNCSTELIISEEQRLYFR